MDVGSLRREFLKYGLSRKELHDDPLQQFARWFDQARQTDMPESAKYFLSRPKESQLAAWVSSQSHRLSSRQILMQKFQEMKQKIGEGKIPVPSFWGGYRVIPHQVEFWQGRENRLHDRFVYSKNPESALWTIERLAP